MTRIGIVMLFALLALLAMNGCITTENPSGTNTTLSEKSVSQSGTEETISAGEEAVSTNIDSDSDILPLDTTTTTPLIPSLNDIISKDNTDNSKDMNIGWDKIIPVEDSIVYQDDGMFQVSFTNTQGSKLSIESLSLVETTNGQTCSNPQVNGVTVSESAPIIVGAGGNFKVTAFCPGKTKDGKFDLKVVIGFLIGYAEIKHEEKGFIRPASKGTGIADSKKPDKQSRFAYGWKKLAAYDWVYRRNGEYEIEFYNQALARISIQSVDIEEKQSGQTCLDPKILNADSSSPMEVEAGRLFKITAKCPDKSQNGDYHAIVKVTFSYVKDRMKTTYEDIGYSEGAAE